MLLLACLPWLALAGEPEVAASDGGAADRVDRQPRTEVAASFALPSDAFSAFNYRSPAIGFRAARKGDLLGVGLEGVAMLLRERPTEGLCAGDCRFGPTISWRAAFGPTVLVDLPLWRGPAPGGVEAAVGPTAAMLTLTDRLRSVPERRTRIGGQARLSLRVDLQRHAAMVLGVQQHWARVASNEEAAARGIQPKVESRTLFEVGFVGRVPDEPRLRRRMGLETEHDEPPEAR